MFNSQISHIQAIKFSSITEEIDYFEMYFSKSKFVTLLKSLEKNIKSDLPTWKDEYGMEQNEVSRILSAYSYGFNGAGRGLVNVLKSFLSEYDIIANKGVDSNNPVAFKILSRLEKMISKQ